MAKFSITTPLDQFFLRASKSGGKGVQVKAITECGIVQVFAAKGKTTVVERALKIKETPGKSTTTRDYAAIPVAPGQWMLVSSSKAGMNFGEDLQKKLKKNGYVSEQSDGRMIFRLTGPRVVELMQKACRLDLHPSKTGKGWCAQTQMAQAGVIIHQTDTKPSYDVLVYSGFAQHFAEWLEHTGAQIGISFSR